MFNSMMYVVSGMASGLFLSNAMVPRYSSDRLQQYDDQSSLTSDTIVEVVEVYLYIGSKYGIMVGSVRREHILVFSRFLQHRTIRVFVSLSLY